MRIAVLIGAEPYQAHHVADIAFELAERDGIDVEIVALLPDTLAEVARLERNERDRLVPRHLLEVPPHLRLLQRLRIFGSLKVAAMRHNAALLSGYDAIVTPTDHLRFVRPRLDPLPRTIFVNHGIGGRAASYSDLYLGFDFVLLPGANDERRLLDARRVRPGRYAVTGYPKFESARRLAGTASRLFDNDRPVVLFNAHSKRSLRSWERFARPLIDHAARTGEFNLIVAPHVKLFSRRPRFIWRRWERLAVPGRVIVDLGSPRTLDMTYALAADIYAGDVSSQIYEFLSKPKPCVFLNAHRPDWRGNPDFPNWDLGEVAETPGQAIDAIRNAAERHPLYAALQNERMILVVDSAPGAAARGAEAVAGFLDRAPSRQVMFAISDLGTGGTARATILVANGLADMGHEVSIAVARGRGVLTGELSSSVKLIELGSRARRGPGLLLAAGALARAVRSERPALLLSAGNHMHPVATLAHLYARVRACKLVLKMTNPVERPASGAIGNGLRRAFFRFASARAERVLVLSPATRDALAPHFPRAAIRAVANPYVSDKMLAAGAAADRHEAGRLLGIGRLVPQKNHALLFEALARVESFDWTIDLLGDGPLLEDLQRQAATLGIAGRVKFHGYVADPLPFLSRAHALVLASDWEGQPAVVLEALACGCPVIATRSSEGVVAALDGGRFGRLVPCGDRAALADAIAAELEQRSSPGEDGRAWADRYSVRSGVRSHAEALGLI